MSVAEWLSKLGVPLAVERRTQHDMALKAMQVKFESQMRARWPKPKYDFIPMAQALPQLGTDHIIDMVKRRSAKQASKLLARSRATHLVHGHAKRGADGKFTRERREIAVMYAAPIHYMGAGRRARLLAKGAAA